MSKTSYNSGYRSKYSLTVHIVFVTKYRRKVINAQMMTRLETVANSVAEKWNSKIVEFSGEVDHVHFILDYPPSKTLSSLIANMKSTMSKTMWRDFESHVKTFYWGKRVFWTGAYFASSCGGVTVEELKAYVQSQERPE